MIDYGCLFWPEHPWDGPGHQGHAHPQSQQVPEGRRSQTPVCPFPPLQWWCWEVCPGEHKGLENVGSGYDSSKESIPDKSRCCSDDHLRTPLESRWNKTLLIWATCINNVVFILCKTLLIDGCMLSQAKQFGWTQGRWPKKSAEFLLHMLKNAESNAELKVSLWAGFIYLLQAANLCPYSIVSNVNKSCVNLCWWHFVCCANKGSKSWRSKKNIGC